MNSTCATCGYPIEFVEPRWQHSSTSLTLDEHHAAVPVRAATAEPQRTESPIEQPSPESLEVPEEFRMDDEEWGWAQTERYMGSTETEKNQARAEIERESFLCYLQDELEADRSLQAKLYELISAAKRQG